MSLLVKALGAVLGLLILVFGIGFLLPGDIHVERAISINAPPNEIFAQISDLKAWDAWSPWTQLDPDAQMTVTGSGIGQSRVWISKKPQVGSGSQEVTALEVPNMLKTHLTFDGQDVADGTFNLVDGNGATLVTWSLDSQLLEGLPDYLRPINAYAGLLTNAVVGKKYEAGLENLKNVVERQWCNSGHLATE